MEKVIESIICLEVVLSNFEVLQIQDIYNTQNQL